MRCNQRNLKEFLNKLSSKIQVSVEDDGTENSQVVLESEDIFFGSLNHTIASLSICKVTDVSKAQRSVHNVNCHVFLDQAPSSLCSSGSGKKSDELCSECAGGSYLMRVFNEVKHSSGTIDLARHAMTASSEVSDSVYTDDLKDDNESMQPTDLSVKMVKIVQVATGTMMEDLQSIPELKSTGSDIKIEKSAKDVGIQSCVKAVKKTNVKGNQMLRKVMTIKPIRRKHRGYPLEKFLMQKVERMRHRLSELKKELAEKEQSTSTSETESLHEALVPTSCNDFWPPQPITAMLSKNDGSTAIVPSALPNQVENETSVALTSSLSKSKSDKNDAEKPFTCPMEGCSTLCIFAPPLSAKPNNFRAF